MGEETGAKIPLWTKNFVIIIIVNLIVFFGFQILMPTLPKYIKSMGISDSMIGLISGIMTVSILIVRPAAGRLLDRIGRKEVLWAGFIIFTVIAATYSYLPTVGLLLLFRFIHGFGWGLVTTASSTIASDVINRKKFGEGMGYFSLSSSIAMAVAPAVGLYLLSNYNFRCITYFSSILVIIALFISFTAKYKKIDKEKLPEKKDALYEKSSVFPAIITFFIAMTYGGISSFISLYAAEKGIDNIGMFFTFFAVLVLFSRPVFGKIADKYGFGYAVIPGLICILICMILISAASVLFVFLIAASLYGIGFGATISSLQAMAVVHIPTERLGAANATYLTGFDAGIGLGTIVSGLICSAAGYGHMYLCLGLPVVIALILYAVFNRKNKQSIAENLIISAAEEEE